MQVARKPQFFDWGGQKVLAIYDGMSESNQRAIADETYDTLCLFYGDWTDLSYLAQVADKVRGLEVKCDGLCDVKALYALSNLTYLRLDHFDPVAPKEGVDFSNFPNLQSCYLTWRPRYKNLFTKTTLAQLTIWGYPHEDLSAFRDAVSLQSLCLDGGALANVGGVDALPALENLDLSRLRKLDDVQALAGAMHLKSLHISLCPALKQLMPVFSVKSLETLAYNGKTALPSLKLLEGLPLLRECIFDCVVSEQDFSALFGMKHLRLIRFIQLADLKVTPEQLQEMAQASHRQVNIDLLGAGRNKPTLTIESVWRD